jgi:hypothetical protein
MLKGIIILTILCILSQSLVVHTFRWLAQSNRVQPSQTQSNLAALGT